MGVFFTEPSTAAPGGAPRPTSGFRWPEERRATPPSGPVVPPPPPSGWEDWGQRLLVAVGIVAAIVIYVAAPVDGLSVEGKKAFSVFVLCTALWISNALPYGITAL